MKYVCREKTVPGSSQILNYPKRLLLAFSRVIRMEASQHLIDPQVLFPQSWINFSIENTPVRSSTFLPTRCGVLAVNEWVSGDPSNMSNANHVRV